MAVTSITDLYDPEVIADLAAEHLETATPLLASGAVVRDEEAFSSGGNVATFLAWDELDEDFVKDAPAAGATVESAIVSLGSYTEAVVSKLISIGLHKYAVQDFVGGDKDGLLEAYIGRKVAEKVSSTMQAEIRSKADATNLALDITAETSGTLSVDSIARARAKFGEHARGRLELFIHSNQYEKLATSDDFKALGSAASPVVVQSSPDSDAVHPIAVVHGCNVWIMDSIKNQFGFPAISGITRSSGVATATTASAHGLVVGDKVRISGATQTEYNGTVVVVTVPTSTTFTYAVSGTPDTPATGTIIAVPIYTALLCRPRSLGLYIHRNPETEEKKIPRSLDRILDIDFRWASTLYRNVPRGVVKLLTL